MSQFQVLTVQEIRAYASDYAPNNYLISGEEFTDTYLTLCMDLAIDEYNIMSPASSFDKTTFPSKSLLMLGTLWKMYDGKALLLARNTMSYSDGGIQIPIEERAALYKELASGFKAQWEVTAQRLKINANMESGWGEFRSDQSMFPPW